MRGLFYSSTDVFNLCKKTEHTIRHCQRCELKLNPQIIISGVLKSFVGIIVMEVLIEHAFEFTNHRSILIRAVIERYINIRFHYIAKNCTEKIKK